MSLHLSKQQESLIGILRGRQGRKKNGLCLCEGVKCCRELLFHAPSLVEFAVCSDKFDTGTFSLDFIRLPEKDFEKIASTVTSQGVLIVCRRPDTSPGELAPQNPFVVVLDRVSDPGNLGTIIRPVRAAGLNELWCTDGTADPFSDKAIRSAIGFQFSLKIRKYPGLAAVSDALRGFKYDSIYRTDSHGKGVFFEEGKLFERSAIIFGGEGSGAGELEGSIALTIPMPGATESLNVAQAATVVIYEYVRRKYANGGPPLKSV